MRQMTRFWTVTITPKEIRIRIRIVIYPQLSLLALRLTSCKRSLKTSTTQTGPANNTKGVKKARVRRGIAARTAAFDAQGESARLGLPAYGNDGEETGVGGPTSLELEYDNVWTPFN
jgi:hypothetical protein